MTKYFIALITFIFFIQCSCKPPIREHDALSEYYTEPHRPQFHFSPEANWMNDPNGMVYFDEEYHLFYQYYPDSTVWGPMHWGHAISQDLVRWEHLPIGLYPDSLGYIFSGSAVYDEKNTSGLGENRRGALVAIFSYHNPKLLSEGSDEFQYQGIAYSNDRGRTWTKYAGNPVVKNPGNLRDFRDPKVIWHTDSQQWVMAVSALDHLIFYGSPDLKEWVALSEFGRIKGSHDGVWECPDLFPLKSENGKDYWVLIENMNPGNPNGGSGTQYFIGQFDGTTFQVDPDFDRLLSTIPAHVPKGEVFEDFENGYDRWTIEGNAFGSSPAAGTLPGQNEVTEYKGNYLLNSFTGGEVATGTLTSETFSISHNAINFLIGGGNHRGKTFIALEIEGRIVREAEGNNSEKLVWKGWDVSGFKGQQARLVVVDNHTGGWGYIQVDQITFANEVAHDEVSGSVWLDAGRDNYAGVTWSNQPEGRRIFLGWMSNWAYAQIVPTEKWRSAMTIPWELSIREIDGIPRLIGNPVKELNSLHTEKINVVQSTDLPENNLANIQLTYNLSNPTISGFKISNDRGEYIEFQYDPADNLFSFDRKHSGDVSFSSDFPTLAKAYRLESSGPLNLNIWLDLSSIEIFIDDGSKIFTEIFFPSEPYTKLEILNYENLSSSFMYSLESIW